jgi:hypothetical protein
MVTSSNVKENEGSDAPPDSYLVGLHSLPLLDSPMVKGQATGAWDIMASNKKAGRVKHGPAVLSTVSQFEDVL